MRGTGASLGALLDAGHGHAQLVFGPAGDRVVAGALADAGARRFGASAAAPAVGALLTNDATSVGLVLGAVAAGGRLVSLPLPPRGGDILAHAAMIGDICAAQGVERVVARDDVAALLSVGGITAIGHSDLGSEPLARPHPDGFALVQFSSGSTGRPKGVVLDDSTLGTNLAAIIAAVQPRPGDVTVSWLPLSHDMGLIGMLLTSIASCAPGLVGGGRIVLVTPESFLREPASWLRALDEWDGTFTAAPDFGYRLALAQRPAVVDLSSVRCAIVGGEIVRAGTLEDLVAGFADAGLRSEALCPAYGMAEIGLAATMTPSGEPWVVEAVDTERLGEGVRTTPRDSAATTRLVASGRPLDGYQVVPGDAAAGAIGPLRIGVPAAGVDAATGVSFADEDGWVATGDLGFVDDDGRVYVCGRADDHLVVNGRNLYAPAIEDAVSRVEGVRAGRVTAVGLPTGEWLVVAERDRRDARGPAAGRSLREAVRRAAVGVAATAPDDVVVVEPGRLPMTSSGKLQRHAVRAALTAGALADE